MQFRNMSLQGIALVLGLMVSMQGVWAQQVQPSELPSYFTLRDGTSNKESIPLHEAMWGLFVMTSDMESKVAGSATDFFKNIVGLKGKTAGELVRYIRQAVDASRTFSVNQGRQLCAARNELTSSSVLVAKFENMEQETLLNRQTHLFNVSQVLDASNQRIVEEWVDENIRGTMRMIEIDYTAYFQLEQVDPSEELTRLCAQHTIVR